MSTCVICGQEDRDVAGSLIEWKHPMEGEGRFDFVPRCRDRAACRRRCESQGEEWPVPEPGERRTFDAA